MRGIEFLAPGDFTMRMFSLLSYIDINQFVWHMPEFVYISNNDEDDKQYREIFSGKQLSEFIDIFKNNYIAEINLRAFPIGYIVTEPKTYEEYERSGCFLVFLCCDWGDIEIYCKDENYLRKVYNEIKDDPDIKRVNYKTDENDGRYILYVG